MDQSAIDQLNASVLAYVGGHSAHSDVVLELQQAIAGLGAASIHGDLASYRAPYVSAEGVAFACATGTSQLHVRLPTALLERARLTGAEFSAAGDDWAMFTLFRSDWPAADLRFWARRAYEHARTLRHAAG